MDNYEDAFAYDMENNAESIFEIQFGGPFRRQHLGLRRYAFRGF